MKQYRVERWKEVYSPNAAMLRLILESEGYRVYQWGDRAGIIYGSHKHAEDQSHWVISGALELVVEGYGAYTLEVGDRDFLPAETYHTVRVASEEQAVVYLTGEKLK